MTHTPLTIGSRARTPFEPSGVVEVLAIEAPQSPYTKPLARVRFLEDHPHGYAKGTEGLYYAEELREEAA